MVSEIWKRIDQVYADWPFLTIQKIRIFVVTLGFLTLLLIGLTALDLGWHHIPIGLVLVMNLSYLPFFVLGLVFTLRGFFEKVVPWVLIGSLFVMVSDSVVVGLSVNPEEFYRFAFLSFIPLLVSGALFSGRRMLLVLWGVSSVWFLLYWKFFCFGLSPELVRQSMDLAIFGVVSLGALTFLTYGLAFLFELATKKSQEQMAEIQEMNACLECRVQKRTRELEDARDMAQQATQAKSEFLANMSHEIRTPLNGILGMAQLMAKKNPQSEERELLQVILDSGHHLLSVIQDVLDYSKIEAGRLEMDCAPFPLEQLLATVSHVVGVRAQEKGLEFRMHVDSRIPPWLLGD
ncbi:MAG TPA: histidine kinase dimerization/phospho-acceptor domain-containing protein, partial [Fibrobacteraceae bacterium]|nr:histidine kinase dimerization/phospho-acceptor domain-containing protein [Fibrobacteraceae bacterium]